MDGVEASRYWCYNCCQVVNPSMESEGVECPICGNGFVEEMESATAPETNENAFDFGGSDSDRALSLWAPILLGMMSSSTRQRRRRLELEEEHDEDNNNGNESEGEGEVADRELESLIRRRRSMARVLQLLQSIRGGLLLSENSDGDRDRDRERGRRFGERMIVINPFNQTIILQGGSDSNSNSNSNIPTGNQTIASSLGDYFIGPGLELLLQHLAENDPNRHGSLPAQKEAVEALPIVKVEDSLQCSVCLEDLEIGAEAKEMPCKHRFHNDCILPWLELHSSCPVCRYQLPSDESKRDGSNSSNNNNNTEVVEGNRNGGDGDARNENGQRFSIAIPWPFGNLLSSSTSGSQSSNAHSSSASSPPNASQSTHTPEN